MNNEQHGARPCTHYRSAPQINLSWCNLPPDSLILMAHWVLYLLTAYLVEHSRRHLLKMQWYKYVTTRATLQTNTIRASLTERENPTIKQS